MGLDQYLICNSREVVVNAWGDINPEPWRISGGQAAYWRKANAIHRWFVENVQDGNDNCGIYNVEVERLQELLGVVRIVLGSTDLVDGTVTNGYTYKPGMGKVYNREQGQVLRDPATAKELLPTTGGFFFGSTDYDQWYWRSLKYTEGQLSRILGSINEKSHKFLNEGFDVVDWMPNGESDWVVSFQYHSSW